MYPSVKANGRSGSLHYIQAPASTPSVGYKAGLYDSSAFSFLFLLLFQGRAIQYDMGTLPFLIIARCHSFPSANQIVQTPCEHNHYLFFHRNKKDHIPSGIRLQPTTNSRLTNRIFKGPSCMLMQRIQFM